MAEAFSVRRNTDRAWRMEQFHFHDQYEILFSLTDNGEFFLRDRRYRLAKGSLLLLPPGELHRSIAEGEQIYDRWVAHFSASCAERLSSPESDLLSVFRRGLPCRLLTPAQESRLQELFELCSAPQTGFGADLLRRSAFVRLLVEINNLPENGGVQLPPESPLSPVLRHIREHPQEDLSLSALSERFFLSRSQLCRRFRAETGFSPNEYVIRSRIMRACTLLEAGASVQEAGERSGFGDPSHFIRTFHSLVGQPPGRYGRSRRKTADGNTEN